MLPILFIIYKQKCLTKVYLFEINSLIHLTLNSNIYMTKTRRQLALENNSNATAVSVPIPPVHKITKGSKTDMAKDQPAKKVATLNGKSPGGSKN